jgi:hypothetical protein
LATANPPPAESASRGREAIRVDTFIVRIYRRIAGCCGELAGTIESVGTGERVGFSDSGELLERLLTPESAPADGKSTCSGPEEPA